MKPRHALQPKRSLWREMLRILTGRFESPRPRHKVKYGRRSR